MQETQVQSLCQEDPLEKGMATHSSILAWRSPWTEEPEGLCPRGHKSQTRLSAHTRSRSQGGPARSRTKATSEPERTLVSVNWGPGTEAADPSRTLREPWGAAASSVSKPSGVDFLPGFQGLSSHSFLFFFSSGLLQPGQTLPTLGVAPAVSCSRPLSGEGLSMCPSSQGPFSSSGCRHVRRARVVIAWKGGGNALVSPG